MLDSPRLHLVTAYPEGGEERASEGRKSDTAEQVRFELDRILSSPQFDASERNRRFLDYVVEETLSDRGDRIKAYSIATLVFGRDDSFDPALDPVVRMEARRLRRSLERFYLVEGETGPIRITLPKGGYVPKFQDQAALRSAVDQEPRRSIASAPVSRRPSIWISAFNFESEIPGYLNYCDGLTRQIAIGLSRYPELAVFMPIPRSWSDSAECPTAAPAADFVLTGDAVVASNVLKVKATLLHGSSGEVIWAETLVDETMTDGIFEVRDKIADRIACSLWARMMLIGDLRRYFAAGDPCSLVHFNSMTHFIRYRRAPERDLYTAARKSLESALAADAGQSEPLACLSQIHSDGYRFGYASAEPDDLRRRAFELASRAVELSPNSSRSHHALGVAHWFLENVGESLASLRAAVALNPNSADAMADLGYYSCLSGDWEGGSRLIAEAISKSPLEVGIQRVGLAFHHFMNGNFERAYDEARQIRAQDITQGFVAKAIASVRLGRYEEAADAVTSILRLDPLFGPSILRDFGGGAVVQSTLVREIRSALQDAGLPMDTARH